MRSLLKGKAAQSSVKEVGVVFHGREQVDRLDKERLYFRCGTLFSISLVSGNRLPHPSLTTVEVQGYQVLLGFPLQVQNHNLSPC